MKTCKYKSDGLGGSLGVSATLGLGSKNNILDSRFSLCLVVFFLTMLQGNYNYSCLSLILALQRNNEVHRNIKRPYSRVKISPIGNHLFTRNLLFALTVTVFSTWLYCLIVLCGDVEVNPGPDSVDGGTDSSLNSTISSFEFLSNHLSIFHLNIQSIIPKLDLIKCEVEAYDVIVFSESWLKPEVKNESLSIKNFLPPFRTDRCDRPGGGVIVYVRDTFSCKRRTDLELRGLEAVWIEIRVKSRKMLIGGFYRPPNSNTAYFDLITESVDRAYDTNITDIYILGDFNYNLSSNNRNKVTELIQTYNLHQLINVNTHFTEQSSSLIDLILVRNTAHVLTSGVLDPFIPGQTRYHCPIIVLLKFLRPTIKPFKRRIWDYRSADFDRFRENLNGHNLEAKLGLNPDIDTNVQQITDALFSAADQSILNKIVTIRPAEHPWIKCHIKSLIRKRKRTYRKFKRTSNILFWERYKVIRNKIVSEIRKSEKEYFDNLDNLLSTRTNSKLFWKTTKQVLKLGKSSTNIPTLFMNNEFAENNLQKANMLNAYFTSQTFVEDDNRPLPQLEPIQHSFQNIEISIQDIKDVLKNLNVSKSCGPDLISPRLLKEGADILARPLCILFNRSLEANYFPTTWKFGNVSPIYKKDDRSLPSNYRPITLLNQVGKVMER